MKVSNASRQFTRPKWGQERRLEFIDFRLHWEGRINRAELVEFFGISVQQASLDLASYIEIAPQNIEYDRSDKVYRATNGFSPIAKSDSKSYLDQLIGLQIGSIPSSLSFVGWRPSSDVVRFPDRTIDQRVLSAVLATIKVGGELEITYQSMRRPQASNRWIAPHALAFDGFRWHTRAWCHENRDFRDFVLTRIQEIHERRESDADGAKDARWHNFVDVVLAPHHGLTKGQIAAVEVDFGMRRGQLRVPMREALVFYFARQLHLIHESPIRNWSQPIDWVNRKELEYLLEEAIHK